MDIRTKLTLTLVFTSIVSMAILGSFAYQVSFELLKEISERQLDALAESKKRDLGNVVEGWRDRVRLIRSRTQLRINLRRYRTDPTDETLASIDRILEDAQRSTTNVLRISIFDPEGRLITSAGSAAPAPEPPDDSAVSEVSFSRTLLSDDRPRVVFHSTLTLDGARIGGIEVVFDADEIRGVTSNFTGLGETGEPMVVMRGDSGQVIELNPRRHDSPAQALDEAVVADASRSTYLESALAGDETVFTDSMFDYRGARVWAATRFLDEVAWGVVVKIDSAEETERASRLREAMVDIGLALSAVAIIAGTLIGFYLAKPIRQLADLVDHLRQGERGLRVEVRGDDEISFLALSLNEFMEHLEQEEERGSTRGQALEKMAAVPGRKDPSR